MHIQFPDCTIVQNFHLFPLKGSEVVLELEWLDKLGDVWANFKDSQLIVAIDGEWLLCGETSSYVMVV